MHSGDIVSNKNTLFDIPEHARDQKKQAPSSTKPRLKIPVRNQIEMTMGCLDDYLSEDHKVRKVWKYVEQLDLSQILVKIKSVESNAGAPAIDPRILIALWLYAFIEGIISARVVNRYCTEHVAFKWLCGGVSVNEHTISDFRTNHGEAFDDLLTQSIAVLTYQGLIKIENIAQDGMKVEAHAGRSSFRREKTLKEHLEAAQKHVETLKKESTTNPNGFSRQQAAAKQRAAKQEVERITQAISELKKIRQRRIAEAKKKGRSFTKKDKDDVRASKTDPEARIMQMPNSGYAPSYNIQFATDTTKKIIVGVTAIQAAHDYGQLGPMQKQVRERLGYSPKIILADSGYLDYKDVEESAKASKIYIPCETVKTTKSATLTEMKERMETEEANEMFKNRASTAEFVNARTRTRGLTQFLVSGLSKIKTVATLFAVGNNMLVWMSNQ